MSDALVDPVAHRRPAATPGAAAERTRAVLLEELREQDSVRAVWEGGSAAFGRADATSDLDLVVVATDGSAPDVIDGIDLALAGRSERVDRWHVGSGPSGYQRFWQPHARDPRQPLCMVDVVVIDCDEQRSTWLSLLEPERHGGAIIHHDPDGLLARARAEHRFDVEAHRQRMRVELHRIRDRFGIFAPFPHKELARGRTVDAVAFHTSMLVTPIVTLLNMQHRPLRFDFGMRYLHDELPAPVVERLVPLLLVADTEALHHAARDAQSWLAELIDAVDVEAAPLQAHARSMQAAFNS